MYIWFNVGMLSKNGVFMGGMSKIIRALAALVFFCTVNSFADDIMATASNGATVILHDNGRWEFAHSWAALVQSSPRRAPGFLCSRAGRPRRR